jgi:hypothetical protein
MRASWFLIGLGVAAALLLTLVRLAWPQFLDYQHDAVVVLMLVGAVVYAAAGWWVLRHDGELSPWARRRALAIILGTAVVARCVLIFAPPVSTDVYRYVWDGRVQAAGINPYRFRPADEPVAFLRDAAVYPFINRADSAVTIYPPVAQMIFWGVTRVLDSVSGMKAAMVAFEAVLVLALLALLDHRGLPSTRILFYAWHPLPLFEFAGSGHVDAAALAFMALACLGAERRRPLTAGALLGAATLVKFFPAVIAPALYRRWGWRLPAAMVAVMGLAYLPYLGVGRRVLGFLPAYTQVEGLRDGSGYFVLNALSSLAPLPWWSAAAYLGAGAVILGLIAVRVVMRRHPEMVSLSGALFLMAVFTLILSPHLPWYFTWVVPFLCFTPSWALLYLSAAAPLLYDNLWSPGELKLHAAVYVPFFALVLAETWRGSRKPALEFLDDGRLRPRAG